MITTQETLRNLLNNFIPNDSWINIVSIYEIIEKNISFQPNDSDVLANYNHQEKWKRSVRNALQTLKKNGNILWDGNSNYFFPSSSLENIENTSVPIRSGMSENQFLELLERRKEIGRQGEEFIVSYEQEQLIKSGRTDLAEKVKRISIDDVGAGYDVLSFTLTGDEKCIEVKTTVGAGYSFDITINEINQSSVLRNYYIYFVRNFDPTINNHVPIIINGSEIETLLQLTPRLFKATITD